MIEHGFNSAFLRPGSGWCFRCNCGTEQTGCADSDEAMAGYTAHRNETAAAHPDPRDGDFVKVRRGNVHIVLTAKWGSVIAACGGWYPADMLSPANGDQPRQCSTCWEAM